MKHLSHWEELEPGDRIFTTQDHFKWVGGPLYCYAGTVLIVLDVNHSGCKACPEGGSDVGHYFTGKDDLESLRLSSKKIFAFNAKDGGKDHKENQNQNQEIDMLKTTKGKVPSKPERSSLASLFDAADASNASNKLTEGQHEVRLNEIKLVEDKAKGTYASAVYEAIDGDEEGKKASARYTLIDAQGEPSAGLDILKRDLALLGYEDVKGSKLPKVLEEITEQQPMCIVNVKANGQYTNVYLQGVSEGGAPAETDDADPDAEDQEAEAEVEVGSKVSFTHAKEGELEGEVIKITDDMAIVLVDKKKYKVAGEDLTLVTDEAEEEPAEEEAEPEEEEASDEIEVGSRVEWDDDDMGHVEGEVKKIKKGIATVEDDDGDSHQVSVDGLTIA